MSANSFIIITTTFPKRKAAEKLGSYLCANGLAACVQYEKIRSTYVWQGEVVQEQEIRVSIKTLRAHYRAIERLIVQHHPYQCPQIVAVQAETPYAPYRRWLLRSVGKAA